MARNDLHPLCPAASRDVYLYLEADPPDRFHLSLQVIRGSIRRSLKTTYLNLVSILISLAVACLIDLPQARPDFYL
jgi:hypothetical protein